MVWLNCCNMLFWLSVCPITVKALFARLPLYCLAVSVARWCCAVAGLLERTADASCGAALEKISPKIAICRSLLAQHRLMVLSLENRCCLYAKIIFEYEKLLEKLPWRKP